MVLRFIYKIADWKRRSTSEVMILNVYLTFFLTWSCNEVHYFALVFVQLRKIHVFNLLKFQMVRWNPKYLFVRPFHFNQHIIFENWKRYRTKQDRYFPRVIILNITSFPWIKTMGIRCVLCQKWLRMPLACRENKPAQHTVYTAATAYLNFNT